MAHDDQTGQPIKALPFVAWEAVAAGMGQTDQTDRIAVPGGWLYRTRVEQGVALAFVPNFPGLREKV